MTESSEGEGDWPTPTPPTQEQKTALEKLIGYTIVKIPATNERVSGRIYSNSAGCFLMARARSTQSVCPHGGLRMQCGIVLDDGTRCAGGHNDKESEPVYVARVSTQACQHAANRSYCSVPGCIGAGKGLCKCGKRRSVCKRPECVADRPVRVVASRKNAMVAAQTADLTATVADSTTLDELTAAFVALRQRTAARGRTRLPSSDLGVLEARAAARGARICIKCDAVMEVAKFSAASIRVCRRCISRKMSART